MNPWLSRCRHRTTGAEKVFYAPTHVSADNADGRRLAPLHLMAWTSAPAGSRVQLYLRYEAQAESRYLADSFTRRAARDGRIGLFASRSDISRPRHSRILLP